jgi:hypothetical protein
MTSHPNLDQLNPEELRAFAAQIIQRVETMDKQITHHESVNEKLAHEIALLNGHDPYAYLKDVLTRLPTQRAWDIANLLPHQWVPR